MKKKGLTNESFKHSQSGEFANWNIKKIENRIIKLQERLERTKKFSGVKNYINRIYIRKEIDKTSKEEPNNVLKNAPHTLEMLTADEWLLPYTREIAAFPLDYVKDNKFWPTVRRVDEAFGDRNLVCSCAPIEAYIEA